MITQLLTLTECELIVNNLPESDQISETSSYYGGSLGWVMPEVCWQFLPQAQDYVKSLYQISDLTNIYVRTYPTGSCLRMHTDQSDYDVTLTVCVDNSDPDFDLCVSNRSWSSEWPFNSEPDLTEYYQDSDCYTLMTGDAVAMPGRIYPHWRPTKTSDNASTYVFFSWQLLNN